MKPEGKKQTHTSTSEKWNRLSILRISHPKAPHTEMTPLEHAFICLETLVYVTVKHQSAQGYTQIYLQANAGYLDTKIYEFYTR